MCCYTCIKGVCESIKMKNLFLFIALFISSALSNIVIRPSDHVLWGTDYELYSRRSADLDTAPVQLTPPGSTIHHIIRPSDVPPDPQFDTDFWGSVEFAPVPAFRIDTHDPVSQDIFISGSVHAKQQPWDVFVWDRLVAILSGTIDRIPVMVDVGANLGYFSLAGASIGAHVIAFEPMSRNARKFSKSIVKNGFESKVTLFQNAVWADVQSVPLRLDATSASNQGNGQIASSSVEATGVYGVDYVNTVSLSHVIREDVDVLKIDTEGTEAVVISGAKRLICNFSVRYILMEFTEVKTKTTDTIFSVTEMLSFLDSAGYTVSDVTPGAPTLSIQDYEQFPPNVLFTLKGSRPTCPV
jgi:FkbM family methyltransferase